MQLLKVFYLLDTFNIHVCWPVRFEVGVSRAVFNAVALLSTANAPCKSHSDLLLVGVFIRRLVFFRFVLAEFAARLFFTSLTAAPPHLPTVFGHVRSTTPVVVLLLQKLLVAVLANFQRAVVVALSLD